MTTAVKADLSCQELVELVTNYLEDALAPSERMRFEEHLFWCSACAQYVEQVRATVKISRQLAEESVPEPAKAALLSAFRTWKQNPR